jgi:hypothetical protein
MASVRSIQVMLGEEERRRETEREGIQIQFLIVFFEITYNTRWGHAYSLPLTHHLPLWAHTHTHTRCWSTPSYSSGAFLPKA